MDNDTLYLKDIATKVAHRTKVNEDTSQEFIFKVIDLISKKLKEQGSVEVNGLGVFNLDRQANVISFDPDSSMANIVNSAFTAFVPEELASDFPTIPLKEETVTLQNTDIKKEDAQNSEINSLEERVEQKATIDPIISNHNLHDEMNIKEEKNGLNSWIIWGVLTVGIALGFLIGFFLRPAIMPSANYVDKMEEKIEKESAYNGVINQDPVSDVSISTNDEPNIANNTETQTHNITEDQTIPTQPKIIYDTIQPGRFLATMSRRHFDGRPEFWIYIYEENKNKIVDPQNVPIGTVLVIPPRNKYNINPQSEASINKAVQEASKYGK